MKGVAAIQFTIKGGDEDALERAIQSILHHAERYPECDDDEDAETEIEAEVLWAESREER